MAPALRRSDPQCAGPYPEQQHSQLPGGSQAGFPSQVTMKVSNGIGLHWAFMIGCSSAPLRHLLKLPARRGDAGPEPSHPRRAISSPSHTLHRRSASGRAICCPCTKVISRRWHRDMNPRNASFLKQCHSPLALRQYSFSVSPSGVSSIETRINLNHPETLATSRSRTSSRWVKKCHGHIGPLSAISRQRGRRTRPIPGNIRLLLV
jgi:hypothetical protein